MSPASDVQEGNRFSVSISDCLFSFKVTCGQGTTDITNTNPVGPCAFGAGVDHWRPRYYFHLHQVRGQAR